MKTQYQKAWWFVLPVLISRFSTRLPLSQRPKKNDHVHDDQADTGAMA